VHHYQHWSRNSQFGSDLHLSGNRTSEGDRGDSPVGCRERDQGRRSRTRSIPVGCTTQSIGAEAKNPAPVFVGAGIEPAPATHALQGSWVEWDCGDSPVGCRERDQGRRSRTSSIPVGCTRASLPPHFFLPQWTSTRRFLALRS